ncbi:hypothetical protein GOODEAATRI_029092 [Goodea atripinnis]|uniref:Uncharacterized protein n=1 Tax=Goodea atripinnis TaxID=208336 RepID=A0ABV0MPM0_9TELE
MHKGACGHLICIHNIYLPDFTTLDTCRPEACFLTTICQKQYQDSTQQKYSHPFNLFMFCQVKTTNYNVKKSWRGCIGLYGHLLFCNKEQQKHLVSRYSKAADELMVKATKTFHSSDSMLGVLLENVPQIHPKPQSLQPLIGFLPGLTSCYD